MIIVADSGSTKTDWRLYDQRHGKQEIETIGLNPYFLTAKEITLVLDKDLLPYLNPTVVKNVFFYGSGCSHSDKIMEMEAALDNFFTEAGISVESDMLGAARALCGDEPGIAGILGTGSNSCVYNGSGISSQVLSLGYVLGDEGSGAVLGKKILKAVLSGKMPGPLLEKFKLAYSSDPPKVLDKIYRQAFPNRFLASFAPFAIENMHDAWMQQLLTAHLNDFFENMVAVYDNYRAHTLNLAGSLAWHLQEMVTKLCNTYQIKAGKILQHPIDQLLDYHLQHQV
jgi:glucosamine kinase